MKRGLGFLTVGAFVAILVAAFAATPVWAGSGLTGSGFPSGPHYNLSILGGPSCGSVPSTAGSGGRHTIFVPLVTKGDPVNGPTGGEPDGDEASGTNIYLLQGDTFAVCDGDACDEAFDCSGNDLNHQGAVFQLPCDTIAPAGTITTCSGSQSAAYCIYAEALGKPGGTASITTCAFDPTTNTEVCNTANVVLIRNTGKPKVSNVTEQLTTVNCTSTTCPELCSSGTCTVELFTSPLENFLWDFDNNGLRNAQLRFYLEPSGTCPS